MGLCTPLNIKGHATDTPTLLPTRSLVCSIISQPYHPCNMIENTCCGLPITSGVHGHCTCSSHRLQLPWMPNVFEGGSRRWSILKDSIAGRQECLLKRARSVSFTQGQVLQDWEFRPSSRQPTLHLSTLRASPVDTGRGTASCWLRNRHTACPLDTASPRKDHWTPGTVLLRQRGNMHDQHKGNHSTLQKDRNGQELDSTGCPKQGRLDGLHVVWAPIKCPWICQKLTQVGWAQRVSWTPPLRLKYAKVGTRLTSAEKKSYHMGSGGLSWSGFLLTRGHLYASLEFRFLLHSSPALEN